MGVFAGNVHVDESTLATNGFLGQEAWFHSTAACVWCH